MDWIRKPLCGSPVAACAIAADKTLCKRFMTALGVPTPPARVCRPGSTVPWHGPVIVKPPAGGSSVGMSLVHEPAALPTALDAAWSVDPSPALVEDYIQGAPVTVGLLELPDGLLVLPLPPVATLVRSGAEFYDAAVKLDAAAQAPVTLERAEFPAPVPETLMLQSRRLWDGLGCHGAIRVDFIVTEAGQAYALEVNTTPGLSRESNFLTAARWCGLDLKQVVLAMMHEALSRPAYDVPLPVPALAGTAALYPPAA
ncbi:D-alanine--D-alanine ligase [Nocardia sp. GAS34]|uniref:D-alanine--D-alanine ligase family protein n=1 Tax=unclassified Nocardia TaxID=2637762 RepID=UPI003D1CAF3E